MTKNSSSKTSEYLLWLLLALLLVSGSALYFTFISHLELLFRSVYCILFAASCFALFLTTTAASGVREFLLDSRFELRKVVWPSRQEAFQTTLIVLAFSAVMSIILWVIDSVFFLIIQTVTGQS